MLFHKMKIKDGRVTEDAVYPVGSREDLRGEIETLLQAVNMPKRIFTLTPKGTLMDIHGRTLTPSPQETKRYLEDILRHTGDAMADTNYKGYWISEDWKSGEFHINKDGNYVTSMKTFEEAKKFIDERTIWMLRQQADAREGSFEEEANFFRGELKKAREKKDEKLISFYREQLSKAERRLNAREAAVTDSDKETEALVELFSSDKKIKDHEVFHALAEKMGIEPSALEEKAYAILQSFFSKGRYQEKGAKTKPDSKELEMGIKVEYEHTNNPVIAERIALDHLTEIPDYYTRLKAMEAEAGV